MFLIFSKMFLIFLIFLAPPPNLQKTAIGNLEIEFLEFPSLPKGKDGNSKNQKISAASSRIRTRAPP